MNIFDSILISSTLHEPNFRLKTLFNKSASFIQKYHPNITVSCTNQTSPEVIKALKNKGLTVKITPNNTQINTYLFSIKTVTKSLKANANQRIFYIDFDRLLHWITYYPDELLSVMETSLQYDLLHIGRSDRAFKSHPLTQQNTEKIINHIGSKVLGFSEDIDIISVSYIFTPELAKNLFKYSYRTKVGFYCMWPVILWNHAKNPEYVIVEGQEWETPDRYQEEINKIGYKEWLENFQSPSEWKKRVRFVEECVEELMELTECKMYIKEKKC